VVSLRVSGRVGVLAVAGLVAVAVVGVSSPAFAVMPPAPGTTGLTGSRPGATQVPFQISDEVTAKVDVGTGNLVIATQSLSLPGVNGAIGIGQFYNTYGVTIGGTSIPSANKWTVSIAGAGFLTAGSGGNLVYVAGDGSTWPFTQISGAPGTYTSPAGLKQDLTLASGVYKLTDRTSRQVISFNADGQPTSIADRNGNSTTIGYTGSNPTSVTSTAGPVAARSATLSYNATTRTLTATQTSGSSTRHIDYVKDANSNLTSIVDAESKTTTFGYTSGNLTTISSPAGGTMTFGYDSSNRVVSVSRTNTTAGSPGTSVTRLAYPSTTQTLVARPNTNQSSAVSAVPHITYNLDTSKRVVSSTDELNRYRGTSFTPQSDVLTSTSGDGVATPTGTTTNTWTANGGDSQTSSKAPTGATASLAYSNTALASKYLPSSGTDDAGHATSYTYNGAGNQLTSTTALASTATLTYNTDGTVATSLAAGNGTDSTGYGYDTNHQLHTITPVTGGSLGVRTITYDDYGRIHTMTDGRSGNLATFGYDKQDRVTSVTYASGPTVTNTYDSVGRIKTRVDANGTTTWGYDQLGRLISRVNTFAGGTITYGYDKSSNLASVIDGRGTTSYSFDDSGALLKMTYNTGTGARIINFKVDDHGRRTDTWLNSDATNSTWAAHYHQDYDTAGRVTRVLVQNNYGFGVSTALDRTYCYNAGSPAPTCGTNPANDRSKIQWEIDEGDAITYTYDNDGRLLSLTHNGGFGTYNSAFTYDARGNIASIGYSGSLTRSDSYSYNHANSLASVGSDGAGNAPTGYGSNYGLSFNAADQLVGFSSGGTAAQTLKYAGLGQSEILQSTTSSNGTSGINRTFVYGRTGANGLPVLEQVTTGGNTAYVENDPVTGEPLAIRTSDGNEWLYITDAGGNKVTAISDAGYQPYYVTGADYRSPNPVYTAGTGYLTFIDQDPFGYKYGKVVQTTQMMVLFGARWYDSWVGRWAQQDALDIPLDPANANRYAFVGDDPINGVDPAGQLTKSCKIAIVALVLAFAGDVGAIALAAASVLSGGSLAPLDIAVASITIPGTFVAVAGFNDACLGV
jgi:RHS repeat-associated protein